MNIRVAVLLKFSLEAAKHAKAWTPAIMPDQWAGPSIEINE
jgi:hypothetical protein